MPHRTKASPVEALTSDGGWRFPAVIGTLLGVAIASTPVKAIALLVGLTGMALLYLFPSLPYLLIVASTPVHIGLGGGITIERLMIVAGLSIMLLRAATGQGPWPISMRNPMAWIGMLFFTVVLISGLVMEEPLRGVLSGIRFYGPMGVIFFTTLAFLRTEKDLSMLGWSLIALGVLEAIIAIAEAKLGFVVPGGSQAEYAAMKAEFGGTRVVGTTWHPIVLGGFLMVTIAFAIAFTLWHRESWIRVGLIFATLVMLYGFFLTLSRSAWIGLMVTAVTVFALSRPWRLRLVLLMSFVGLSVLAAYSFNVINLIKDLEAATALGTIAAKNSSSIATAAESFIWRLESWGMGWLVFLDKPVLGIGPLETMLTWNPDYLPSWATYYGARITEMQGGLGGVHNAFIQILAELGILGFTVFSALWLWAGRSIALAMRHDSTKGFAILLAGIITGQFVYLLIDPVNREIWLTLAVAAALGPIASRWPNAPGIRISDQAAPPRI